MSPRDKVMRQVSKEKTVAVV